MPLESENDKRKLSGRSNGPKGRSAPSPPPPPPMDGDSEIQTIVIPSSPEIGSNDQPGSEDIARVEPREEAPIPLVLQVVHLPNGWKAARVLLSSR